jgi:DnaJ-class molecular chaperone
VPVVASSFRIFLAISSKKGKTVFDFNVMLDPEKHGYEVCTHCNGYGSSLKEESAICTKCYGRGLVKKKTNKCKSSKR